MPDLSAISGALTSLNAAFNITKAMKELRDWSLVQSKVIELQSTILDAQNSIFSANQERSALIEKVGELEKQIAKLEAWETQKQRYELAEIGTGAFAYVVKPSMKNGEPPHCICSVCYEQGQRALLQLIRNTYGAVLLKCPRCKTEVNADESHPNYPFERAYADAPTPKSYVGVERCPICNKGMLQVVGVSPDPVFGAVGLQQRQLKCLQCGHMEARQHDPGKLNR